MKNKTETKLIQEDIDKIRNNAVIMASERDKQMVINKISRDKGLGYVAISNGYMISMVVDATMKDKFRYLLSTHNPSGKTDPEVSKVIAHDIIGDGYTLLDKKPGNFVDFTKEEEKHIDQEKITQEDIKKVRDSIVVLTEDNIRGLLSSGGIRPVILSNWYKVALSADVERKKTRLIHLSISNSIGITDIKIAEKMALDIIGEDYQTIGPMHYPNVIHFMKDETPSMMIELFPNIGDKIKDKKEQKEEKNIKGKQTKGENLKREQTEGENLKREQTEGENLKREQTEGENLKREQTEGENLETNAKNIKKFS